ncbi:MAG: TPM domain-containing protein [Candidatus Pacebacteria bacterium]|nr:TPM domain-containing protein [Candidatus Paceibacterota bacterium]
MNFSVKKWIITAVILLPVISFAYVNPGVPTGFVNDFTGTLTADQKQQLETKISAFEKSSSNEISIAIIPDLGGDTIENFAVKLFEDWKIGKEKNDNGVLVLVAMKDREMRIEVGYGLEGALTDAQSYWIINNEMTPNFKAGNYYAGINSAVDKIIAATQGEYIPSESKKSGNINFPGILFWGAITFTFLARILGVSKSWWEGGALGAVAGLIVGFINGFTIVGIIWFIFLVIFGFLFDFFVSKSYTKGKTTGVMPWWWHSGGHGGHGGGGFGGFGGGGSGGGGASGRW